ncbi:hypothetical protein CU097_010005 [Rhizopus azygosporus]|uniref:Uncharacterized protein n=1 Tax=Rhizopus azygosporus TaxID=86630 RepID=A0A367K8R3_RHIAZ|nr:hypothetical protein CU097_010005 [Rhizopus azygosporus]
MHQVEVDALVRELRNFKFQREDVHLLMTTHKRTYFKEGLYTEDYRKLRHLNFWIGEEPAMNYFIRPIQCNHEVDKSNGNRELTDSKLVLTQESISKSQIDYTIQKLEFHSSIAIEVNKDQRGSLGKRMCEEENDQQGELVQGGASSSNDFGVKKIQGDHNEKNEYVWLEWQRFLKNPISSLMKFSSWKLPWLTS